jgi:hypothetical protein
MGQRTSNGKTTTGTKSRKFTIRHYVPFGIYSSTFDITPVRHYFPFDILSHSAFLTVDLTHFRRFNRSTFFLSTFCPIWRCVRWRFFLSAVLLDNLPVNQCHYGTVQYYGTVSRVNFIYALCSPLFAYKHSEKCLVCPLRPTGHCIDAQLTQFVVLEYAPIGGMCFA